MSEKNGMPVWMVIFITASLAGLLTLWGIYVAAEYGIALFLLVPFFIGFCPTVLYSRNGKISEQESFGLAFSALFVFIIGLMLFSIEGLICIAMAAPIGFIMTGLGCIIGLIIVKKTHQKGPMIMLVLILVIPLTAFMEKSDSPPDIIEITTSIKIDAEIEVVWKNVIEFPKLSEPKEFLFQIGISYPISAQIKGKGLGAIRYCNFSTGSFIEPITRWEKPHILSFDVSENPPPMKELSFWDLDSPHLHDYFVSKKGEFKLTKLSEEKTLLTGTTWYTNKIKPAIYWQAWSDYIIHAIHNRVLRHIKAHSEKRK